MKIFLSWSGDQSRLFAEELKPWLEIVLSGTDVWLSSEDIDKGTIWFTEIINELSGCNAGVICVTRQNYLSPWIHFEAGGMIKGLGKRRVGTILLDIDYPELQQPLNQFNGTRLNRIGAWQLVKSLAHVSDRPYKDKVLERTFEKFWPDLEQAYQMLFPTSHDAVRDVEQPMYFAPQPATEILGTDKKPARKKRPQPQDDRQNLHLFNGVE